MLQAGFNVYRKLRGSLHYLRVVLEGNPFKLPANMVHRGRGYRLLRGEGVEIGALHQPAIVSSGCHVSYLDCQTKEEAVALFPEVNFEQMVEVNFVANPDRDELLVKTGKRFDFVILNHVIEHVANPIRVLRETLSLVDVGGLTVISAPDKEYTFDRPRTLTPFEHLYDEYKENVVESSEEHYLDFLRAVHPEVFETEARLKQCLQDVKKRREHVHVWNSASFRYFLLRSFDLFKIEMKPIYESYANRNRWEYFSVWEKR